MKNKVFALFIMFLVFVTSSYAEDIRFVQIDGIEYASNPEAEQRMDKIVCDINRQKNISFIVFSGNNIAKSKKEDLERFLKSLKRFNSPCYIVLGQKDINKQKGLGKSEYMKIVSKKNKAHKKITSPNYVFEKKGVVFIVLDGSKEVIPLPSGYYKPEVVDWLDEQLTANKNKNVVIIQHFPIVPPCEKETRYTSKPEYYLKTLKKHNNVKAIISGHFDTNNETEINKVKHISTANAPIYRIIDMLDCESAHPEFWSIIKD